MAVLAEAGSFDLVLWGVLLACAALLLLAYQTRLPYPIMLVAGGAAIGFFSGAVRFPTTIALDGKRLLAVDSQFDKRMSGTPETLFDVATIAVPKAPKSDRGDDRGERDDGEKRRGRGDR